MIRIIKGTYGHKVGKVVIPIGMKDDPIALDVREERRLVDMGVAEYVGDPEEIQPEYTGDENGEPMGEEAEGDGAPEGQEPDPEDQEPDDEPESEGDQEPEDEGDELPEYSDAMKLTELKEVAALYGVDASSLRSKADVIKAIEAAKAEAVPGVSDGDIVE